MAAPLPNSTSSPLLYFEVDPPADLAQVVLAFWGFEVRDGKPHEHTIWPDASLSITWGTYRGRTSVLGAMGARTEPMSVPVDSGAEFRGIRLWPDAARSVCGIDPLDARGARLPLVALGDLGRRLQDAIADGAAVASAFGTFEDVLRASLTSNDAPDPVVRQALLAIDTAPDEPIADIAARVGLSDRQLRRRFSHATGLSPKEYARIRRLRQTMGRVLEGREPAWSTIAAHSGFADQAHLINEIVRMTAYTPTLLAERLRLIEHVGVKP